MTTGRLAMGTTGSAKGRLARRHYLPAWLVMALCLAAGAAWAQNSVRAGEFVVHYNALPTTTLTPEVARRSGVTRSANRALVNVAVRRGDARDSTAVAATVVVTATNLAGQRSTVPMREVREGDAIYYLGEARYAGHDTLAFDVQVEVEGQATPIRATFRQEFFPQ